VWLEMHDAIMQFSTFEKFHSHFYIFSEINNFHYKLEVNYN